MERGIDFVQDTSTGAVMVPVFNDTGTVCQGCDLKYGAYTCINARCFPGDRGDLMEVVWKAVCSGVLADHILAGEVK